MSGDVRTSHLRVAQLLAHGAYPPQCGVQPRPLLTSQARFRRTSVQLLPGAWRNMGAGCPGVCCWVKEDSDWGSPEEKSKLLGGQEWLQQPLQQVVHPSTGFRDKPAALEDAPSSASTSSSPRQDHPGGPRLAHLPGRRRSLLVGINYYGTDAELSGCVNDARRVQEAIWDRWGFQKDENSQRVLLDEPGWPEHRRPTLRNMRSAIGWLVDGAQTGDALYFHFSGHGGREPDGYGNHHETLCPVDYDSHGMLMDTEMFETLVKPLPSGCRLTCFLDCCHSAGALDLPYLFLGTQGNIDRAMAGEVVDMAMSKKWVRDISCWEEGDSTALLGDLASMGLGLWDMYRKRQDAKAAGDSGFASSEAQHNTGVAVGEVIAFTGCRSDQTSADVGDVHGRFDLDEKRAARCQDHAGGALTAVFLESVRNHDKQWRRGEAELTYLGLLERMRVRLHNEGFSQVPQLASSLLVDLKHGFSLTTAFMPAEHGEASSRGLDATDGALLAGTAACAAGFLSALASTQYGDRMLGPAFDEPQATGKWKKSVNSEAGDDDVIFDDKVAEENDKLPDSHGCLDDEELQSQEGYEEDDDSLHDDFSEDDGSDNDDHYDEL